MKHLLKTTLLVLALLLPSLATAHDFEVDGIYYNILNNNEATVTSGTSKYIGDVTIPSTVTYNGTTYSVTTIGNSAFSGCTRLTSINIPNSVTSIGSYAFEGCTGLTSINIPNSVTSIGNNAFSECGGLTSIIVASSNPFYDSRDNCNAIIKTANNSLVFGCKNTNIPNSVISIGTSAFSGCTGLTSINIPNSVTSIGSLAFRNCTGLISINIGNSVTSIGYEAFWGCTGLTDINIPNSVTSINDRAFEGTAWYDNQPNGLVYAGLVAYQYKGAMPNGTSITLKEGSLGIASSAFYGCTGLTSINIPNSVTSIGSYAFEGCIGLTNIEIPNSVTHISDGVFSHCI